MVGVEMAAGSSGRACPLGSEPIARGRRAALWPAHRQSRAWQDGVERRAWGCEVGDKVRFLCGLEISAAPGDV